MSRSLTSSTALLCLTEPRSSIKLAASRDHPPAGLETRAGQSPASQADPRKSGALPGLQVAWERQDEKRYISRRELRAHFPVSDMTIWRWMHDPEVAFPRPHKLGRNGRNFWWLPEILEWERSRVGNAGRAKRVRA